MSRKTLFLLPVLAVAVLGLLLASSGPDEPVAPPAPTATGTGTERAAPEPLSGEPGEEPAEGTGERTGAEAGPSHLPLTVRVVDGLTGNTVPGAAVTLVKSWKQQWPLERRGDLHHLSASPFAPGDGVDGRLRVEPPEGWVAFPARGMPLDGVVHRRARELEATVVVWPEAPVTLLALDENEAPIEGVTCEQIRLGHALLPLAERNTGPDGTTRLEQVPLIPGELLTVRADLTYELPGKRPILGTVESAPLLLDPARAPFRVIVRFGRHPDDILVDDSSIGIGLGGGAGGRMPPEPPRDAKLDVRVLRADGSPAADVLVCAQDHRGYRKTRTDEAGRAFFTELISGHATVTVREPGFLFSAEVGVALEPGETARVTLREEVGRPFCVRVLDHVGRPRPCVYVDPGRLNQVPLVFLADGVQPLNFVTDLRGEVRFEGFPAGEVRVGITYGTRNYAVPSTAEGLLTITLTLPREDGE